MPPTPTTGEGSSAARPTGSRDSSSGRAIATPYASTVAGVARRMCFDSHFSAVLQLTGEQARDDPPRSRQDLFVAVRHALNRSRCHYRPLIRARAPPAGDISITSGNDHAGRPTGLRRLRRRCAAASDGCDERASHWRVVDAAACSMRPIPEIWGESGTELVRVALDSGRCLTPPGRWPSSRVRERVYENAQPSPSANARRMRRATTIR